MRASLFAILFLTFSSRAQAAPAPPPPTNEVARPAHDDPDRARILTLQEALDGVVQGRPLGRLRVGLLVQDLWSGRVLYGHRSRALMDPASNQKVLSTMAALLRLGGGFRFRTEVLGADPDVDGMVAGDLLIRGDGDPSLRLRHLEELAEELAKRGVRRIGGAVLGDSRRIGSVDSSGRSPLRVASPGLDIRVRPGSKVGARALVTLLSPSEIFSLVNHVETRGKGKTRLGVSIERAGSRFNVVVSGVVPRTRVEAILHRSAPSHPLYSAFLFRQTLIQAGISVDGEFGLYAPAERPRVAALEGARLALGQTGDVDPPVLPTSDPQTLAHVLASRESPPLSILLRRVNKDSDNEWAERVLEAAGAEVYGGAGTTAKGVRVIREALAELGLPSADFASFNGSGLGHQNRVTAAGMAELLRRLFFDPRIGPDLAQSLSVGGVDGTTKHRFRGSSAAHRVRAKTGTLTGVSCLSGYVGDNADTLAFAILVEGHKNRSVPQVRAAQVAAVNAMMRFARGTDGTAPLDEGTPGSDVESDGETDEGVDSTSDVDDASDPAHTMPGSSVRSQEAAPNQGK